MIDCINEYSQNEVDIFNKTIMQNPIIKTKPYNFKTGKWYDKQVEALLYLNRPGQINYLLAGGGGFGGKTILGCMFIGQYLIIPHYRALVTRKNQAELLGTDSMFEILSEWVTNPDLPDGYHGEPRAGLNARIKMDSGAVISFKAFNDESKRQKVKSESYHHIDHEEGSELAPRVLKFSNRSLRRDPEDYIPLASLIQSNPASNNRNSNVENSNQYIYNEYVADDAENKFIEMDWRHNPFITKSEYEAVLDKLDPEDKAHQKYGDWLFKQSNNSLITQEKLNNTQIELPDVGAYSTLYSLDLAGAGRDKTALNTTFVHTKTGHQLMHRLSATPDEDADNMIINHIQNDIDKGFNPALLVLEQEPGSFSTTKRYYEDLLEQEFELELDLYKPDKAKYVRAKTLARAIRKEKWNSSNQLKKEYYFNKHTYWDLFVDDFIYLTKSGLQNSSPDLLDTATNLNMYLKEFTF
ncbi:MAG: hypothetical protein ACRC1M_05790 [Methanobacteriaceae archaeon]